MDLYPKGHDVASKWSSDHALQSFTDNFGTGKGFAIQGNMPGMHAGISLMGSTASARGASPAQNLNVA